MTATYTPKGGSSSTILGAGLNHLKASREQLAELACDAMLGTRPFLPSQRQAADAFGVPIPVLRQHLKARREANGNGNGGQAAVEDHTIPEIEEAGNGAADENPSTVRDELVYSIAASLWDASPAERAEVARRLGVDWCWDCLIAPCVCSNNNG
jgi:hypothetical protein